MPKQVNEIKIYPETYYLGLWGFPGHNDNRYRIGIQTPGAPRVGKRRPRIRRGGRSKRMLVF